MSETKSTGRGQGMRKHGAAAGYRQTPEYSAFHQAKARCTNEKHAAYRRYGGRGIEMRWGDFESFLAYMGPRPTAGHTLERLDTNGHYEPGNVVWATRSEQSMNLSHSKRWLVDGSWYGSAREAADALGVWERTIRIWCNGRPATRTTKARPPRPGCRSELKYPPPG